MKIAFPVNLMTDDGVLVEVNEYKGKLIVCGHYRTLTKAQENEAKRAVRIMQAALAKS